MQSEKAWAERFESEELGVYNRSKQKVYCYTLGG